MPIPYLREAVIHRPIDATAFGDTNRTYFTQRATGYVAYSISDLVLRQNTSTVTNLVPALGDTVYVSGSAVGTATSIQVRQETWGATTFTVEFAAPAFEAYNIALTNTTNVFQQFNNALNPVWNPVQPAPYNPQAIAKRKRAEKKANQLLMEFLTLPQRKEYKEKEYVHIESESGKIYRIHKGRSHNVTLIEDGKRVKTLCAHPVEGVPNEDTMLAQILMLQTNEKAFLKMANASPVYA